MSKFVKTSYTTGKEILKFPDHHVAIAVTVDDSGIVANADGKKIVAAGTIVGGGFLASESVKAVKKNTAETGASAEGVLLYDVDVTYGAAPGAVVIHGFISLDALPEAPVAEAKAVLKMIQFIK